MALRALQIQWEDLRWMLLLPNARVRSKTRFALGYHAYERTKVYCPTFHNFSFHCFTVIRRSGQTVLLWHKAVACQLPKTVKEKQHPCQSIRLLFILDPIGKGFFASMLARKIDREGFSDAPFSAHGCLKWRRRETAHIVIRCAVWRCINKLNFDCVVSLHDQSNAFVDEYGNVRQCD